MALFLAGELAIAKKKQAIRSQKAPPSRSTIRAGARARDVRVAKVSQAPTLMMICRRCASLAVLRRRVTSRRRDEKAGDARMRLARILPLSLIRLVNEPQEIGPRHGAAMQPCDRGDVELVAFDVVIEVH